jgi:Restriction endonuclease BamHI
MDMISEIIHIDEELIPKKVREITTRDVISALSEVTANSATKFIINDSEWFNIMPNKKGIIEAKPRVMNSAEYITKKFASGLTKRKWQAGSQEKTLLDQRIDGYLEIQLDEEFYSIDEGKVITVIQKIYENSNKKVSPKVIFDQVHNLYVIKSYPKTKLIEPFIKLFKKNKANPIRIALEFETGNIASSFRAFSKLNFLFNNNQIDVGIFISSTNKHLGAARIWPVSNRNGSFEELKNRQYRQSLILPMIEIGFSPDKFSQSKEVKFLNSDGSLYLPLKTKEITSLTNGSYSCHKFLNQKIWKKND